MTLRERIVAGVIAGELLLGLALVAWRAAQPRPPAADLATLDPITAGQLDDLARRCRTTENWVRLGDAYIGYGFFRESEACCRQVAAWEPHNAEYAYTWAFALERLGETGAANEQYRRAIELGHPRPGDCWYFIGRNLLREEKPDEARDAFARAGDHASSRYELARFQVRAGKLDDTAAALDRLASEYPRALQPYLLQCKIDVLRDDTAAERRHADEAGWADDRLPTPFDREWQRLMDAFYAYGVAHEWRACHELVAAGKLDEAEPRLRRALEAQWEPAGADLLAEIELQRGRADEAVRLLTDVVQRAGPSVEFLVRLGDAHEEGRNINAALVAWLRAAEVGPPAELKDLHYRLATHFEKLGNAARSRQHLAGAYLCAGMDALAKRRWADARTALEEAVKLDAGSARAWFYLGELRRRLGQTAEARTAYQRCLELDPDHGRALTGLALLDRKD